MAKEIKTNMEIEDKEEFEDKEGKKVKIRFKGGITHTQLVGEPTKWYKDNVLEPLRKEAERGRKEEEKQIKIAQKMREIAEKELEKEKFL